jgi:Trk-type K+ transport system membrane component
MKFNSYLIQLAIIIILIFGGIFTLRYFRTGELLLDQIIGFVLGVVLLLAAIVWRKNNK